MLWMTTVSVDWNVTWYVTVDNIWMMAKSSSGTSGFCSIPLPRCSGASWPLLTRQVFLGETLLSGLCFPIIISYASTVSDHSTTKLTEHGFRGYNRNLPRPVRIRQDLLMDQIILLCLRRNDFEQRSIFIEQ